MASPNDNPHAAYWHRRAALLALKLNFHHWLARFIPKLAVLVVLLAIFELFRREVSEPVSRDLVLLLPGLAGISAWAWFQARHHFCNAAQGLVRLETVLGLHNRLSAAQDGIVPWPAPAQPIRDGYALHWKQLLLPIAAGAIFLLAAHLIPVTHLHGGGSSQPIAEPPEFAQIQNWINTLQAQNLIEPEKLQDLQSALNKLKDHPPQDWYKQNDLEAANSLKELMEQSMNTLSRNLNEADRAVQQMQEAEAKQGETPSNSSTMQALRDELRKSGENLSSGTLPLNRETLGQLTGGEKAGDRKLSPEQLQALHDRLQKGAAASQTASNSSGGLSKEMKEAMNRAGNGTGKGMGTGHGEGPGGPNSGGLGGGESSAPLELHDRDKQADQGPLTAVSNDDLSRAALGETLKISSGEHNVDPNTYHGTQAAGAAQVEGTGGEAVWRSTYDPQEAETLSRFYK